jgi:hypothetical protein
MKTREDFYNKMAQELNMPTSFPAAEPETKAGPIFDSPKTQRFLDILSNIEVVPGESGLDALGSATKKYKTGKKTKAEGIEKKKLEEIQRRMATFDKERSYGLEKPKTDAAAAEARAKAAKALAESKKSKGGSDIKEINFAKYLVDEGIAPDIKTGLGMGASYLHPSSGLDETKIRANILEAMARGIDSPLSPDATEDEQRLAAEAVDRMVKMILNPPSQDVNLDEYISGGAPTAPTNRPPLSLDIYAD